MIWRPWPCRRRWSYRMNARSSRSRACRSSSTTSWRRRRSRAATSHRCSMLSFLAGVRCCLSVLVTSPCCPWRQGPPCIGQATLGIRRALAHQVDLRVRCDNVNRDPAVLRGTNLSVIFQDTKCSRFFRTIQGRSIRATILLLCFLTFFL